MNSITSYNNNLSGITYTGSDLCKVDNMENHTTKQDDNSKIITTTDSAQINQKDENIINTKKAYDAFNKTSSEYQDSGEQFPHAYYFIMFRSMMEDDGISVPDFKLDGENNENTNFIGFVDKLKDFAKSLSINDQQFSNLPSKFFEFCDSYKENLIKNGCK